MDLIQTFNEQLARVAAATRELIEQADTTDPAASVAVFRARVAIEQIDIGIRQLARAHSELNTARQRKT